MEKIEKTGIICTEKFPFSIVDGVPTIDFNNNYKTIYNKDFNLSRGGLVATVIGYRQTDATKDMMESPVYKKDYLESISEAPNISVDVELNRGSATALEKHYKLTECSTMEDLENYGNNIFNL